MDNPNTSNKITLWTAQRKIVLDTIREKGIYHVKKEFILKKYEESAKIFLEAYNWFVQKAESIVPKPEGAEYPIWLFTDLTYVDRHEDSYILKIKVEREQVILFDQKKWNHILNLSYVPKDKNDAKRFADMLRRQGIDDETDVYMENYYPHLKAKVKKSWDRLFDDSIVLSDFQQASLWEIREDWIEKII